jgi:hypothetical protein
MATTFPQQGLSSLKPGFAKHLCSCSTSQHLGAPLHALMISSHVLMTMHDPTSDGSSRPRDDGGGEAHRAVRASHPHVTLSATPWHVACRTRPSTASSTGVLNARRTAGGCGCATQGLAAAESPVRQLCSGDNQTVACVWFSGWAVVAVIGRPAIAWEEPKAEEPAWQLGFARGRGC